MSERLPETEPEIDYCCPACTRDLGKPHYYSGCYYCGDSQWLEDENGNLVEDLPPQVEPRKD